MKKVILIAGGTGNLGERVIHNLLHKGAEVRAVVRHESNIEKLNKLEKLGVKIFKVNMLDLEEVSNACLGVSCVISTLQGLHDVIVDTQKVLLDAAIKAKVPRFIPSDFSLDFTRLTSENRNFDLRREFHKTLDKAPISATSIFNGAFAEILGYNIPILDLKKKSIGYWGDNPDWHLDFTTMDDTASFTAASALDESTPKMLRIASFQVSPNELVAIASKITNSEFKLIPMGSLEKFAEYNKSQRTENPEGENEVFPKWQNGQYMHDMFSVENESLDNNRYPDIKWTDAEQFISSILKRAEK